MQSFYPLFQSSNHLNYYKLELAMNIYKLPTNSIFLDNLNQGLYEIVYIEKEEYEELEKEVKPLENLNFKTKFAYILQTEFEYQKILYTPVHKYKTIDLPSHIEDLDREIELEAIDANFSYFNIRRLVQKHPYYKIKVNLTDSEDREIDTLGKWLFGTPAIKGHIQMVQNESSLYIRFPKNITYVERMLRESIVR